ncbi:MAG: YegS/Rv2252/BmrU family lipid kinase [Bacteroidia bacterium]|nr:YegS/Rv2252/BmrU family lipid kinase [Bacteroidia bacterium]
MTDIRKFYFIINPISGGSSKTEIVNKISEIMNENQTIFEIGWWEQDVSVKELVDKGSKAGFNTFVAVGGDGTINNVAVELVNTDKVLGIVPYGSGNGFARHLGIKGHLEDYINILTKGKINKIDCGLCNEKHFFINIAGIGFDAHISHLFSKTNGRGIANYAKLSIVEGRTYNEQEYELIIDGKKMKENAFLISIANGSQWGNEFYIAPDAELNDGQLRCCILKKPPLIAIPGLIRRFLTGEIAESKYYKDIPFKTLQIIRKTSAPVHFDGEPAFLNNILNFKVIKSSLNVIYAN